MAKKALLIGVSQYEAGLPPLAAAPNDVQAMLRVLQNPELGAFDEVQPLVDPDLEAMQTAIARLFQSCQKGDTGLLYFSGHGITDDSDRLYLATRRTSKDTFKGNAVPASFIQDIMRGSSYQRQHVLILDCCYSGAFAEGWQAKSVDVNVRQQLEVEGSVVLTSSTSTQKSFEQEGADLSLYTSYIVQGIESGAADRDRDGYISADELHEYAKQQVQAAKPAMKPEIYGVRQGIKIVLAKAKVDQKLEYRRLVEKYTHNGEISIVGEDVLGLKREEWGLSNEVATAIENEVLEPDRKRLRNLQRYQTSLERAAQQQFPLTQRIQKDLKDLQELLGLRDEDISSIQDRVLAPYAAQEAERQLEEQQFQEEQTNQSNRRRLTRRNFMLIAGLSGVTVVTFAAIRGNLSSHESSNSPKSSPMPTNSAPTDTPKITPTSSPTPLSKSQSQSFDLGNGVKLEMLPIPSGTFTMGTSSEEKDPSLKPEQPQIKDVNISAFYMGKNEVTQAQWQAIMGNNPSKFQESGQNPVELVSWNDAQEFCKKLSQKAGRQFRLPSEAEWEYACRSGTTTAYSFSNDASQLGEYAWYDGNSEKKTHPVGQKKPNAFGLYDMHGNVWEWCQDVYGKYGDDASDRIRKTGKAVGNKNDNPYRLLRGGAWNDGARLCRSANRGWNSADFRYSTYGFRVVCADV